MAHADDLLAVAADLIRRGPGKRGKLPQARIRRSISTSYYALFHFVLEEASLRAVGSAFELLSRRRLLARAFTHAGIKTALNRVRGDVIDGSVAGYFRADSAPPYVRALAGLFLDAQNKRHQADYDLNAKMAEGDAALLLNRVGNAIAGWRAADTPADRDFKHALCLLMLLQGKLRESA